MLRTQTISVEDAKNYTQDAFCEYKDESIVGITASQNDIFALSNAILESNKEKTINTYLDLIASDNDVNRLINLVSKTIRESLIVNAMLKEGSKQSDVALRMKVSPNRAFYMVKNAKGIDVIKAEDYLCELSNLDYKIKSGQVDAKTGFEFFLFSLK